LQLKEQIIKNMVLESESIREIMHNELCASILAITELHLEALGKDPQLAPEVALAILQIDGNAILQHITSAILEDFTILFRTVNSIPPDSQATATLVNTREIIRRALVHVFSTSMILYAKQARDNELCLALMKKAKESLKANATAEAVIVLDAEVPATQQQLRDIIQREASKISDAKCSALHNELAELKKSMNSRDSKKHLEGPRKEQERRLATKKKQQWNQSQCQRSKRTKRSKVRIQKSFRKRKRRMDFRLKPKQSPPEQPPSQPVSTATAVPKPKPKSKIKKKMGKTTVATMDDVALGPDRVTGTEVETEGAIPPPPGRPRDRGRLRICTRLQSTRQTPRLTRTCNHAHLVVS
jgi:hypothetical protein